MKSPYDQLHNRKATCQEIMAEFERLGIPRLPPDHPVFSEGPTITFVSSTPVTSLPRRASRGRSDSIEYFRVSHNGTLSVAGYRNLYKGQDAAYRFFLDMSFDDLRTLGVVVVEGQCPGNDYCAAELRGDIEAANRAAVAEGISVRFRKARKIRKGEW